MDIKTAMQQITVDRLGEMVKKYNIKAIYALFSGGDDSTITTHFTSYHPLFKGAIFANTLTGDKETIDYVRNTAKIMNWPLYEVKPQERDRYIPFIATFGIPTAAMHPVVFGNLKGKPLEAFAIQEAKRLGIKRKEILFVSGLRRAESQKRMRTVQMIKEVSKNKGKTLYSVWGAPIFDWQRSDLEDIFKTGAIIRNWHAFKFGASRECGCKATEGNQDPILEKQHNPIAWERRKLQIELVQAAYRLQEFEVQNGLIDRQDATIPSYGIPSNIENQQMELFPYRYDSDNDEIDGVPYLCVACENQINGDDPDKEMLGRIQEKGLWEEFRDSIYADLAEREKKRQEGGNG